MAILAARHVTATIGSGVRRDFKDGEEFLIAPIVAVREGVLNGELVRVDTLGRLLDEWQGTPITINHPPKQAAESISKTHAWVRSNKIGTMENVHVANERLQGELWMPTKQPSQQAVKVMQRIERGETLEVSVGFLSIFTGQQGVLGKKAFREVTQDAAPNHVALLPDDVGACSIKDGCGTPRAASANVHNPEFEGVEATPWQQVDHTLPAYIAGANAALSQDVPTHADVADLPSDVKQWIVKRTMLGDPDATTAEELLRAPVVNPSTNRLNRAAVTAVFGHRVEALEIESDRKLGARQAATELLKENFGIALDPKAAQKEKSMSLQAMPKIEGKRMGAVLTKVLARSKNAGERKKKITQLATAAEIDEKRVKSIVAGEEEFTEERITRIFADVLEINPGLLFQAAFGDDDEFMAALEPQTQTAESPMAFFKALKAFKQWWPGSKENGGNAMKRCELEASIKKAQKLSDEDAAALKGLSDTALKAFAAGIEVDVEGFEPEAPAEPTDPQPAEPAAEPKQKAEALTVETLTGALKENNKVLKDEIKAELKQEAEAKERESLTAAAKAKGFSDEDIAATPLSVLKKLVGPQGGPAVYAGQGGTTETPTMGGEAHVNHLVGTPDPYDAKLIDEAQKRFRTTPGAAVN